MPLFVVNFPAGQLDVRGHKPCESMQDMGDVRGLYPNC